VLSLGVAGELGAAGVNAEAALEVVKEAQLRFADNLWVSDSISSQATAAA